MCNDNNTGLTFEPLSYIIKILLIPAIPVIIYCTGIFINEYIIEWKFLAKATLTILSLAGCLVSTLAVPCLLFWVISDIIQIRITRLTVLKFIGIAFFAALWILCSYNLENTFFPHGTPVRELRDWSKEEVRKTWTQHSYVIREEKTQDSKC